MKKAYWSKRDLREGIKLLNSQKGDLKQAVEELFR